MLREISCVAAPCSLTAEAIVVAISLTSAMVPAMNATSAADRSLDEDFRTEVV
jgi:hypothetical protein